MATSAMGWPRVLERNYILIVMRIKQMPNVDQIILEIEELQDVFLQARSFFPALSDSLIGKTSFPTAKYYAFKGYNVFIHTGSPITEEFRNRYTNIGKWLNENAIIRLFGILHYHKQVGENHPLVKDLDGYNDVRFCCWIRNVITKTKPNYAPQSKEGKKLRQELIEYYSLNPDEFKEGIPTPVNKVVEQIFEGCKKYLRAKYKNA